MKFLTVMGFWVITSAVIAQETHAPLPPWRVDPGQAIVDLETVRAAMGSGVLAGSKIFEAHPPTRSGASKDAFREALQKEIAADPIPHGFRLVHSTPPPGGRPDGPTSPPPFPVQRSNRVSQLRQIALDLDHLAHDLECLEAYDRADRLRGLAQQLREDARRREGEAPAEPTAQLRPRAPSELR